MRLRWLARLVCFAARSSPFGLGAANEIQSVGFKPPDIPPPTNSLVSPMLTDMYQITMVYAYWKAGKHDEFAVFDLFFRKNPFGGEFCIFAGLDEVLKFVQHFRFTHEDIEYLR